MNALMPREFRLSAKEGLGVRCDANGAFVGDVAMLRRVNGEWLPRHGEELSDALSKVYGLPVDASVKQKGLGAIARALNDGDIARAACDTVFTFPRSAKPREAHPFKGRHHQARAGPQLGGGC